MVFKRYGLQTKIIFIIAITVISVVAVSTFIAMLLTGQLVEEEVYRRALAQARLTAHALVNERAFEDPQALMRGLRQIESDLPSVKQADVFLHSPDHHLLATTDSSAPHLELDHIPNIETYNEFESLPGEDAITIETPDGDYWIMGVTILKQGNPVGCLTLKVSKSHSSLVTRSLVLQNLVLMLASLAVVALVIHIFFLRSVRAPMKEMVRVMEAAEGGELSVRAGVASRDETGQLAAHLNRMLVRIENFNAELARQVEAATAELERRNEELGRINEELFDTQRNLARSERLAVAGQLAASLAHEIGTPLNSISGHVQLLARRPTGDQVADRRLKIIDSQIDTIVRSVKQLLSWTRKFELRMGAVNLPHIVEESVLLSSPSLEHRGIKVKTEIPHGFPEIIADGGYLQQVVLNLINNSMDAMPRGGELRLRLRHPANGEAREVAIEIEDTGEGIPPETLARIFEPMFTTKRMGTGAGLGLAICDQIVRQHGGMIRAQSRVKHGTVFTINLPLDCREKPETPPAGPSVPAASAVS
jgi:two-component system, NtrC family, sensor kinase